MNLAEQESSCSVCEYAQPLSGGDLCICRKRGVVPAVERCRSFCFDPLKIKVSAHKLPQFIPQKDLFK